MELLIFDFDGTICDSFELGLMTLNNLADRFGYRKVPQEEWSGLRNLTSKEMMRFVGISMFKLPIVARKAGEDIHSKIDLMFPFRGIREALSELKRKPYKLGILTSNTEKNVSRFLKNHQLEFFDFVYSGSSIFGKSKMLKKLLAEAKTTHDRAIYVGDETRDIQAARDGKVKIVSVTWGFNSRKILQAQNPDYLIDAPSELISLFC